MIKFLDIFEFRYTFCRVELLSPELHRLFSLGFSAREDDHFTAHFCCELDCEMAQSADADNTNTVSRFDIEASKCTIDSGAAAHQWGGERPDRAQRPARLRVRRLHRREEQA